MTTERTTKKSLADAFKKSVGGDQEDEIKAAPVRDSGKPKQANRQKKKSINAFIDPAGIRELKLLALNSGRTQQELYKEAINDLLVKYGMKPLA